MKRVGVYLLCFLLLALVGCSKANAPRLEDEAIEEFEVEERTEKEEIEETPTQEVTVDSEKQLAEKFEQIEFHMVSGTYSRKILEGEQQMLEMFALDKNNFIRIATKEGEQEVFAYNYLSDDFTYIYYFDGDMVSKTVFNVETGAILQDNEGYVESLKLEAEALKIYFNQLIGAAGIAVEEL